MRQKDGIDSVIAEERFEKKLREMSELPAWKRKRKWNEINARENEFVASHREMNETIEFTRLFQNGWRLENPDGEYQE